ncbi:unnamed protein product [Spirodela intermedia]|uniref:Uncharacterized protein n=1 Tax=Spirodela intermedia TaxID=51605 RepID=A0A7I8LAG3_SPIIN|nr:unnamed protein product [Spirodela intermedia]
MDNGKDLESVSLIDVFSEDDILLSSPPGVTKESGHIEESMSPVKFKDKSSVRLDPVPLPSDSPEPKNCTRRYNLRKSMAWDSAFFTSEGVLDPEELADANNTFRNIPKQSLPGIPEYARKSSESNADLDGDKWCVGSGEANLVENLQSSVQKSQTDHARNSLLSRSSASLNSASKNWRHSPRPKMKPSIASPKHGLSAQQSVAVPEEAASNTRVATASLLQLQGDSFQEVHAEPLPIPLFLVLLSTPIHLVLSQVEKSQPQGSNRNPQKSSRGTMLSRASRLSTGAGAVNRQKLGRPQPATSANPNNPQNTGITNRAIEESPGASVDGSKDLDGQEMSRDIQRDHHPSREITPKTSSHAENSSKVEMAGAGDDCESHLQALPDIQSP